MALTFYFYDLETSGFDPKEQRIMQFAGQRTDLQLLPTGEPHNFFLKLSEDILPDPGAVLVTGITPQQTIENGVSEADFLKVFHKEIAVPDTIFVGFNSVRFDDEFMRYLHYRNFYDPYEWHWKDGRSRWDLLDLTRMTRALRPDGIRWPTDTEGKATNRLELLTHHNGLDHANAHDALSDVLASVAWAKLIHDKQPKLFQHLLTYRDKRKVAELVDSNQPFVYSSGKYSSEFEKTTAAVKLIAHGEKDAAVVFDLRSDPADLNDLTADEILGRWQHRCREYPCPHPRLPLKTIKYNRCPAVAPLGVLDDASQKRLKLDIGIIEKKYQKLKTIRNELAEKVSEVVAKLDSFQQAKLVTDEMDVDARLYDNFFNPKDKPGMRRIQQADKKSIADLDISFHDDRLKHLLPLYKARNYPASMSDEDRQQWDIFCRRRLLAGDQNSRAAKFFNSLSEQAKRPGLTAKDTYLLEELQLWGQRVLPLDE